MWGGLVTFLATDWKFLKFEKQQNFDCRLHFMLKHATEKRRTPTCCEKLEYTYIYKEMYVYALYLHREQF